MNPDFVRRLSASVPRYTSYPPAPHFSPAIGSEAFCAGLADLAPGTTLSLYVHIPFCRQLCWYCGCSTKVGRGFEVANRYLDHVELEARRVGALLKPGHPVKSIHWGGGTPNFLEADAIGRLAATLSQNFDLSAVTEYAVEIDPRWLSADQIAAFARAGVTRASLGVQDFEPKVQEAINREQSFETTRDAVLRLREAGISGINIDLVYGLPHQTRNSVAATIAQVIELSPDRIALFGYAHMPQRARHQAVIDEATLPDTLERYAQSRRARHLLTQAGYVAVGLDHFARPGDALATGEVHRNFQGYTSDGADALIGLGASSISRLPSGYFQNSVQRPDYEARIAKGGVATARGFLLSPEDTVRGYVIERLMCDFTFSRNELERLFGDHARPVLQDAEDILASDDTGLVERTEEGFRVTDKGQPFVRSIAACFDGYFAAGEGRYSAGV